MSQPGPLNGRRVGLARSCATGMLACIAVGLNVTACGLSLAALVAWAAFGGALYGLTG